MVMDILNIMSGPGRYLIGEEEKQEILDVLDTGHLFRFGGESDPKYKHKVVSFEDELKMHLGSEYCLAVICALQLVSFVASPTPSGCQASSFNLPLEKFIILCNPLCVLFSLRLLQASC